MTELEPEPEGTRLGFLLGLLLFIYFHSAKGNSVCLCFYQFGFVNSVV